MATPYQMLLAANFGRPYNLRIPIRPVCQGHISPGWMLATLIYDRPGLILIQGPRGGGKSLLSGFALHIESMMHPGHSAKILGGSLAQSQQIYEAISTFRDARPEVDPIEELLKTKARYSNGSTVEMLTASPTSVRGPHVPTLQIDEVDEVVDDIRESSMGMAMAKGGLSSSVVMTSTWHRVAGPMATLMKRGSDGEFPTGVFCAFDILERCPESRSGPAPEYPGCTVCPIQKWCHSDRDRHPEKLPKAKRSCGHYSIETLIDKTRGVSERAFESDYLCMEPRAPGMWFTAYDECVHLTEDAEYRRDLPYHVAIDPGVHTGAVLLQVARSWDGSRVSVNVFGDYYRENTDGVMTAEANGQAIAALAQELTGLPTSSARVSMDSAARQRSSTGATVVGEYQRAYCTGRDGTIEPWISVGQGNPKADGLQFIEALLRSASKEVFLFVHPRCKHLRNAFKGYRRKMVNNQWVDEPEDPQHPFEEVIDSLAGGLKLEFPAGRIPQPIWPRVHPSQMA